MNDVLLTGAIKQDFQCSLCLSPITSDPVVHLQPSGSLCIIAAVSPQINPRFQTSQCREWNVFFFWLRTFTGHMCIFINKKSRRSPCLGFSLSNWPQFVDFILRWTDFCPCSPGGNYQCHQLFLGEGRCDASASVPIWSRASYFLWNRAALTSWMQIYSAAN